MNEFPSFRIIREAIDNLTDENTLAEISRKSVGGAGSTRILPVAPVTIADDILGPKQFMKLNYERHR